MRESGVPSPEDASKRVHGSVRVFRRPREIKKDKSRRSVTDSKQFCFRFVSRQEVQPCREVGTHSVHWGVGGS